MFVEGKAESQGVCVRVERTFKKTKSWQHPLQVAHALLRNSSLFGLKNWSEVEAESPTEQQDAPM